MNKFLLILCIFLASCSAFKKTVVKVDEKIEQTIVKDSVSEKKTTIVTEKTAKIEQHEAIDTTKEVDFDEDHPIIIEDSIVKTEVSKKGGKIITKTTVKPRDIKEMTRVEIGESFSGSSNTHSKTETDSVIKNKEKENNLWLQITICISLLLILVLLGRWILKVCV